MIPQPPPGQGPIDPRNAFAPPAAGAPQAFPQPQPAPGYAYQPQPMPGGYPPPQFGPGMMPPPNMFGPQPPRRGGAGRAVLLTLLVLGLLLSVFLNLVMFVGNAAGGGDGPSQFTVSAGDRGQQVAVVPLRGLIDGNASMQFDQFLDNIEKDGSVKVLVVEIDSPGGTVTASDEIYERLRRFKAARQLPVVVAMGSMATSGGYYTACGADYIFAQPTTITGNIGVLAPRFNLSKLMEKYGVEDATVVAKGSTFKNAGSMFTPETPAEREYWQGLIDQMYARFKTVVQQGRGSNLKGNMDDIASGKAFTADEAIAFGLVDKIGYSDDAYAYAATTAGLKNPRIVRYERKIGLMDLLSVKSNVGPMGANGAGVNVDAALLDELTKPRLMYLWSTR